MTVINQNLIKKGCLAMAKNNELNVFDTLIILNKVERALVVRQEALRKKSLINQLTIIIMALILIISIVVQVILAYDENFHLFVSRDILEVWLWPVTGILCGVIVLLCYAISGIIDIITDTKISNIKNQR